MTNEIFDGSDMIGEFLGKGKRFSDQTRYSLSQRAVEPLDMVGYPLLLFDHPMLLCFNHTLIRTPAIGIKHSMLPVALGY